MRQRSGRAHEVRPTSRRQDQILALARQESGERRAQAAARTGDQGDAGHGGALTSRDVSRP